MLEKDFMQEVLKRFDKIDAKLDEHSKDIKSLKETVHENTKFIIENSKKIDNNSKKIDSNSRKIEDLSKLVEAHNRILVNFETNINDKISALFDSFDYNQDKHTIYEKNLDTLNSESFDYSIRISALEDLHKPKLA